MKSKDVNIIIYTKIGCPFCYRAINLLKDYKYKYSEIQFDPNASDYTKNRDKLFYTFGQNTFPIILINNKLIGGCNDLEKLLKI
jgi:glutaredoxin 3